MQGEHQEGTSRSTTYIYIYIYISLGSQASWRAAKQDLRSCDHQAAVLHKMGEREPRLLKDLPTTRNERLPNPTTIFFEECTRINDELLLQKSGSLV